MRILTTFKQLLPAIIITNLIFISNAYAFFFSDSDVDTLKKTYVSRYDNITIDDLIRTHKYFTDGEWDTETDKNGNKCVTYTAIYDTKAVLYELFGTIYKEDLDYLAKEIEDNGDYFICKLIFTMEDERFRNVTCEIKTSEDEVLGIYHPMFNHILKIRNGCIDTSNGLVMPAVIAKLAKGEILAEPGLYDPATCRADSFKNKLRYLYLEHKFSHLTDNMSFLKQLVVHHKDNGFSGIYSIIEIENIEFDENNEDMIINTKADIYDCSEQDLATANLYVLKNDKERLKKILKDQFNVIYSTRQELHIAQINKGKLEDVGLLPQEKKDPIYVGFETRWVGNNLQLDCTLSLYDKDKHCTIDSINKFIEKQKTIHSFSKRDYRATFDKKLNEATIFLKPTNNDRTFSSGVVTKSILGKNFVEYIIFPYTWCYGSNEACILKDNLSKEDIKYLEWASSSKNIIILDKTILEKVYINQRAAESEQQNIEGSIVKYIYATINGISITDKLELINAKGHSITRANTKGNKEQFIKNCTENNRNSLSITGLFSLDDKGELYIDNYDLIKCNINTETDNTAATNF